MNSHRRRQRHWSFATLAIAFSLPLVAASVELDAAPKPSRARAKSAGADRSATPEKPEGSEADPAESIGVRTVASTVRLNHMRSPWVKVLREFAEATNKELIADVVPAGQFSRWDFKSHEPGDALRILNHELQKLGFRLIDKRDQLVLIELKKSRREYQPAAITGDEPAAEDSAESEGPGEITQTSAVLKEIPREKSPSARRPQADVEQPAVALRGNRQKGRIEQVSGEKDVAPPSEAEVESEALKTSTVRLKARDAVAVSRIMYNVLKDRAELVDDGPRGLQGFRVYQRAELDSKGQPLPRSVKARVQFTIGIDESRNQLVVEAGPHETASVHRLIKTLDVLPKAGEGTVRAVSTNKDAGLIASALQPEIDRLAAATKKAARRSKLALVESRNRAADAEVDEVANAQEDEAPATPPAARRRAVPQDAEEAEQPGTAQSLIKSLKGDVEIQSIPDLGIMVIIGNEQDAETVISVIREIERLSAGAVPSVEIVFLRHINSEALASLLTSVYDRLSPARGRTAQPGAAQQQSQNVLVIPIARPNAVLIVAAKVDIDSARDLAEQLDQPSDPHLEYKVFRLKYAIPSMVVEAVEAMYATGQAQGQQQAAASATKGALAPQVKITPDVRTNSVIVQARPRDLREVALLIRELDTADSAAISQIRIFTLKNAVADELGATLQTAIQSLLNPARIPTVQGQANQGGGGGAGQQGNPELREVKSMILEYLDMHNGEERTLQSGILADIRVTPDMRTNSIVVTAPAQSMELVARLIEKFDKPNAAVAEIKVFNMERSDAQATLNLLNGLFGITAQQRPGGQGGAGQAGQNFPGVQIAGADDASSTLIPIRFNVDVRTNSIVAIGGAEALRVVEAVVLRLDQSEISQRKTQVYKLKNTPAADVATAIGNFLQTQRQVLTNDPGLLSPFEQIEREVIVVPEPVSNSLLVSATPRFFPDVMKLVTDIDMPPRQVLVQALLVEVQLDNADEFGVELGLQDSVLFDRSLISTILPVTTTTSVPGVGQVQNQQVISATATPGYTFNNQDFGNNVAAGINTSRIGPQGLTSFNLQRINGDLGYGGLVLSAGSESVNALLRAVAARRRVDILSRPQIRTLDNQQARIQVGRQVPRISGFTVNQTTGFAAPVPTPVDVGIILQVQPRVTPDNMVVMYVLAQKNELSLQTVSLFVNPDGSTVNSPIIDTTNAYATISVKTGQTIVLGGMITKRDETNERKVPLLGDIPVLGQAFRYDFKRMVRTELLIFLTPRVVTSDAESERIKEIESQRMNFIEAEAEMMHGPLFGVQAETPWTSPTDADGPMLKVPATLPPPNTTNPGIAPMSIDDADDVPTTLMPANAQGSSDEDLSNPDLSRKKSKAKKGSAIVPAGYEATNRLSEKAGRSNLGPSTSKSTSPARAKSPPPNVPRKPRARPRETE